MQSYTVPEIIYLQDDIKPHQEIMILILSTFLAKVSFRNHMVLLERVIKGTKILAKIKRTQ